MAKLRIEPQLAEPAAPAPVLQLECVERRYDASRPALLALDLVVARGEFLVIQGPCGSGKSVLLRLIAGLERPSAGRVRVAGEDYASLSARTQARLRRVIGFLPPGGGLLAHRSALENVALAAWAAGATRDEGQRRARAALALLSAQDQDGAAAASPCSRLSTGACRMVALARALVNRPALLLLDDLLDSLDEGLAARAMRVLDQFCAAGVTVLASHRAQAVGAAAVPEPWPVRARRLCLYEGARMAENAPLLAMPDGGQHA